MLYCARAAQPTHHISRVLCAPLHSMLYRCHSSNIRTPGAKFSTTSPDERAAWCAAARSLLPLEAKLDSKVHAQAARAQLPPHVISDLLSLHLWPSNVVLDVAEPALVPDGTNHFRRDRVCVVSLASLPEMNTYC